MPQKKITFAVVGCGHIGKRHAFLIQQNPEAQLVGMADTNTTLQQNIENEHNTPFFDSLESLLASGLRPDVINICTPNHLHAPQSLLALEAGCHVVCEKPMALTKADCEDVIYKSLQMSKLVFCVMQNRYSPPSVWLKELVSKGILGKIFMVQINCYWNRDGRYYKHGQGNWKGLQVSDGGTLFTQFSHFVDIMFWLFGDIKNIQARFYDFNHQHLTEFEDSGTVTFDFKKGGAGCIHYSTSVWDKNLESSITIIAENGSVKIGGQYMNEVEYCHIKDYQMPELPPASPPNDYGNYKGSAANHHFIIENVIDTLQGRNVATTNALEGLKVVEIIERIYEQKQHKSAL
ncbi:Predicted dehydrogenase [Flexibacter flexilis DSM 6793]|uniref:Predicted dehydrogenase n=1 Tax=Flexibacter flexilis DSM 6793 TaxID=927664 RepID=A0A1I1MH52_9BACT|nr:Gfo/Idh/MocA family oxidoreductase [Flexibacter flexilis]SFC82428.1 Predicted dehydrogenase [Flexibacter flexilis DSM 6793]